MELRRSEDFIEWRRPPVACNDEDRDSKFHNNRGYRRNSDHNYDGCDNDNNNNDDGGRPATFAALAFAALDM